MRTGGYTKPDVLKPFTIYLWRNGDKYEGASPVVTRDGIKDIYRFGWMIEKVPDAKRNEDRHQAFRAKVKVKNLLNNTLNVLNWYGKKVLDSNGNIDMKLYQAQESVSAFTASQLGIDINQLKPINKFPVKEITPQKAKEYKLI